MTTNEEPMTPRIETNHFESNIAICRAITQGLHSFLIFERIQQNFTIKYFLKNII